jgi:hypothetical protein
VEVAFEDLAEEGLFALEEVVEAAGVDVGVGEKVGHAGSGESSLPEEVACGVDEAVASGESLGHGRRKFLTEIVYRDLLERPTKWLRRDK